jgi:sugar/nucleoside kinase (ribokinase family)
MKKYHIYSIGHALVDIDFEVTHALLEKHSIEKGVMTLIDNHRAAYLLKNLGQHSRAKACAGSAANTTILLAQLGGKAFYSGCVGKDEFGDIFHANLTKQGVATNITDHNRLPGPTGTCLVMVTPDTDRTMNTHLGISGDFSLASIDSPTMEISEYFYIEGYLISSDTEFEVALKGCELAKQHGAKIVITLSDRNLVKAFRDRFLKIMNYGVDLIFCNDLEAQAFTETQNPKEASQKLKDFTKNFVITLGPNGALIYDNRQIIESPAYDVKTIDSVGAGDTFAGSFLYGITHGLNFEKAGEVANFASGLVVSKYGPRLNEEEIARIKEKIAIMA